MPKVAKELTDAALRRALEPGRYHVGGVPGLCLVVPKPDHPDGYARAGRHWVLRVVIAGKRRDIGIGGYPEVGLADARQKARALRERVRQGEDPLAERAAAKRAVAEAAQRAVSFKSFAEEYIGKREAEWRNAKHSAQWTSTLNTYAFPIIGSLQVGAVQTEHVLRVLEQPLPAQKGDKPLTLWIGRTETASRLRGRIESILDAASVRGLRSGDNPARWKGHLDHLLPRPSKIATVEHHAALPWSEVPAFVQRLLTVEGHGAKALLHAILTGARSKEVRLATWKEIDLDTGMWVIPGGRMKAGKEHRVPLSDAAVDLLRQQPQGKPDDLVFPGMKGEMSDMTLGAVIKRLNAADNNRWVDPKQENEPVVPHGFRSSFRDWVANATSYPRELAEKALAHALASAVEAAYQRSDMLEKRRRMMEDWAAFVMTPPAPASSVTPITKARARKRAA